MNTYNVNDKEFQNSNIYQEFIKENPGQGFLKIRAYAARGAVPIEGLRVVITKEIGDDNVIFFEGLTDRSGVIENISLPTPRTNVSNLTIPPVTTYQINTTYEPDNISGVYSVNMYENVYVVQNINVIPDMGGSL